MWDHVTTDRTVVASDGTGSATRMVERCVGTNYVLQLADGTVEIHTMPFRWVVTTLPVNKIASVELLRRSVMPPTVIASAALLSNLALRLGRDELLTVVSMELHRFSEIATLGLALICLVLIVERWLYAKLVVTPSAMEPIILSLAPARSAKRFVEEFQNELLVSLRESSEGHV